MWLARGAQVPPVSVTVLAKLRLHVIDGVTFRRNYGVNYTPIVNFGVISVISLRVIYRACDPPVTVNDRKWPEMYGERCGSASTHPRTNPASSDFLYD